MQSVSCKDVYFRHMHNQYVNHKLTAIAVDRLHQKNKCTGGTCTQMKACTKPITTAVMYSAMP